MEPKDYKDIPCVTGKEDSSPMLIIYFPLENVSLNIVWLGSGQQNWIRDESTIDTH
jgi:hypothetical protein